MKKIFVFNKDEKYDALLFESGPDLYVAAKDFADELRNFVKYDQQITDEERAFAERVKTRFYYHFGDLLGRIEENG